MSNRALVAVVDDDESVRESLPDLLNALGYLACAFASAEEFLESGDLDHTQCLLLDVAMPAMDGVELQQELRRRHCSIPIVFITAHAPEGIWPRLLAAGAVECLAKPFSEAALVDAVSTALGDTR